MPLTAVNATQGVTQTDGQLRVGGQADCIIFRIGGKNTGSTNTSTNTKPAHIVIAKKSGVTDAVCQQVQNSEHLKHYFSSKVTGLNGFGGANATKGAVAIGSSISIYDEETTTTSSSS